MKNRLVLVSVGVLLALAFPGAAETGGPFEQVVGVGAGGQWRVIPLARTGPGSDRSLFGSPRRVDAPSTGTGYVRIFPAIGGFPGIPGRFYPRPRVLCFGWHDPRVNCSRASAEAMRLLRPFAGLPWRLEPPTVAVEVRHRSRVLRFADGNVLAALELALDREPRRANRAPADAVQLGVSWRGPRSASRPRNVLLGPRGVYARGRLYPLSDSVWCYVAINVPLRARCR